MLIRYSFLVGIFALFLISCGDSSEQASGGGKHDVTRYSGLKSNVSWPYKITGQIDIGVGEGEPLGDGYNEINFGGLRASEEIVVDIEVSGSLLRSAGIPPDGENMDVITEIKPGKFATYKIVAIQKM